MRPSLQFCPYEETRTIANVVVDGSPNESTVLTLTHWPGIEQPAGLAADLSAEMAFNYLDARPNHPTANVVTNNHFDQDGLVAMFALIDPQRSLGHRQRLIDIAAAGDFATYEFRDSARASMAIWAYAQRDRSPLGSLLDEPYEQVCATLYETLLPLLIPMVEEPTRFRDLWEQEDVHLAASEQAIADGSVTVEEVKGVDLAIVTITGGPLQGGHRFASETSDLIHPMAINNATRCCRLLIIDGHEYLYKDRYETWVQFRSRQLPKRVDLEPLRDELETLETGAATWTASKASSLTPTLRSTADSSLTKQVVSAAVEGHLQTAPTAWDPYRSPEGG